MKSHFFSICRWLFSTPHRALERAYQASKQVRNIHKNYIYYKNLIGGSSKRSGYNFNVNFYLNTILNRSEAKIYWALLEFKLSWFFLYICKNFFKQAIIEFIFGNKGDNYYKHLCEKYRKSLTSDDIFLDHIFSPDTFFTRFSLGLLKRDNILLNKWFDLDLKKVQNKKFLYYQTKNEPITYSIKELIEVEIEKLNRKLFWIETALADLDNLKQDYSISYMGYSERNQNKSKNLFHLVNLKSQPTDIPYESVGLVPRSITRTLSRFQTELAGRSAFIVLPEFRLAKYQAIASVQYLACLICFPLIVSNFCKIFILEPLIQYWWNTSQSQVFLSIAQEQKALIKLQQVEELLWLDIMMADSTEKYPQDLSFQIHLKTINLVETYNQESIQIILHMFTDFISLVAIITVLIWGKKRLSILNSWIQEVFYSLSDTMKAFFILLFTDLCIGFHSPHGWEILIGLLLEHFGFSHNKPVISCFVSTFPVILDTVLKYWIFRHLNRISPSIVVSYHTMNE
uniref:Potassium/proton antiporter CemA n=1 Tax=Netrium digitus TaxID=43946 RepID=A0A191T508_9VIRI|nr:chloroplast enveloppe membrane protein [Netrium digitus]ANI25467.1 chloroplast enveloppe membrane protein [Netrium digitus]